MGTLSGVALCSRGVDLLIYGISAAVSMHAAATLRNPERLIPALPPQRTHSAGGDGVITQRESTPLDSARPPSEIMEIVRETVRSYGLPEDKVQHCRLPLVLHSTGVAAASAHCPACWIVCFDVRVR